MEQLTHANLLMHNGDVMYSETNCKVMSPTFEYFCRFKGHKNKDYKVDSCFTNTDTHIVSGSEDGNIYYWDLIEAKVVHTIDKAHCSACYSLSYHPKEPCMITASSDGAVKVWRPKNWEPE